MPVGHNLYSRDGESEILIFVWRDSDIFPPKADEIQQTTDSFARDLNRAIQDGKMTQEEVDGVLASARHWDTVLLEHWD